MERRLFVLRHATAGQGEPSGRDHDRPLADDNQLELGRLRANLDGRAGSIQLVRCSSAARAVATLEGVRSALLPDVAVTIDPRWYLAGASRLLEDLRTIPPEVRGVLVIGHHPGLANLIRALAGAGRTAALATFAAGMPPGGLAELDPGCAWSELAPACGLLEAFVVPHGCPDDRPRLGR